jgi:hypothetical protein
MFDPLFLEGGFMHTRTIVIMASLLMFVGGHHVAQAGETKAKVEEMKGEAKANMQNAKGETKALAEEAKGHKGKAAMERGKGKTKAAGERIKGSAKELKAKTE